MIYMIRSASTMPGKAFDYLGLAKEMEGVVKRVTGVDVNIGVPVGGDPSAVAYFAKFPSLTEYETAMGKLMADADYRNLVKKAEHLVVPGSTKDQLWRQL